MKIIKSPMLTVILPTRDRCDTLAHTLRTLVGQTYSDCEFIVSDNCSLDQTRQVVVAINDPRVRYINTGARLGMSENWEFALEHARGTYVTYIGDDDGFLPGALEKAMDLLVPSGYSGLVWDKVEYCWPDHIDDNLKNWFSLKSRRYSLRVIDGRRKLGKVMRFEEGYNRLPCLYNGIIRKSLLDDIKAGSTNRRFFNSITPDVYSGIALGMVIGSYLHTDYPFSVNGASRHSNGTAFTRQIGSPDGENPHTKFIAENSRKYHESIRMAPSPYTCVMGEYLSAKSHLPDLPFREPNWRRYVHALVRDARNLFRPDEILASARHTSEFLKLGISVPGRLEPPETSVSANLGFKGDTFNFIAPTAMVDNVFDACALVAGMLPELSEVSRDSAYRIFLSQMVERILIEAKNLYRSF